MNTPTAESVIRKIPKRKFPVKWRSWKFESGQVWMGNPAVWVWITLNDDESDWIWENRVRIREVIHDELLRKFGKDKAPWPLVHFRAESEVVED